MNVIKFSHDYPKLHGQTSAELLAVRPIHIDRYTPQELLEYDTKYIEINAKRWAGYKYYPLTTGVYIQLIFLGDLRIPFCTIRKAYPPRKVEYYNSKIGEVFQIEIKEDTK